MGDEAAGEPEEGFVRRLERLKALTPDQTAPPPGTVSPPSDVSGSVPVDQSTVSPC